MQYQALGKWGGDESSETPLSWTRGPIFMLPRSSRTSIHHARYRSCRRHSCDEEQQYRIRSFDTGIPLKPSDPGAMELAASKVLPEASWLLGILGPLLHAFLDVEGRRILRLTCKQLSEDVEACTRCLTLVSREEERLDLSDHRILHKCRNLERLVILIEDDLPVLVLDGLPDNLHALIVEVPRWVALLGERGAFFLGPLPCLRSLKELSLKGIRRLTQVTDLGVLSDPHALENHNCGRFGDVSFLDSCTNLQTLSLEHCRFLVDVSALGSCTNLRTLTLSGCVSLVDLSPLGSCTNLHTLNMFACESLVDLSALGSCMNLRTLTLSECEALVDVSVLGSLTNLQTVYLCDCTSLVDVSALGACSNLETLNLSGCSSLVDVSALGSLTNLQRVYLCGCHSLVDLSALGSCRVMHQFGDTGRCGCICFEFLHYQL